MELTKTISFQERDSAPVGKRVRAVGMVFYVYGKKDLDVGKMYRLRRQPNNPKDKNCIEIVDTFVKSKAVLNRDVALMLSPLLDSGMLQNAEWWVWLTNIFQSQSTSSISKVIIANVGYLFETSEVIEEAKWSKGDRRVPAKAHKIKVTVTVATSEISKSEVKEFLENVKLFYLIN